jgi:Mlo family
LRSQYKDNLNSKLHEILLLFHWSSFLCLQLNVLTGCWASKVMCKKHNFMLLIFQLILAVGTKLQAIIASMALEIQERHAVIQGMPLVKLSDHHFWLGRPRMVLFMIHFSLFVVWKLSFLTVRSIVLINLKRVPFIYLQNAFQLTYFLWVWVSSSFCIWEI